MNFTREPIVETIISAKEGYKLSLKSSKHQGVEEYLVDAVEVVSFSGALFFRSQEKPRPFFLPIHDYEVQEIREARLTVKSPMIEKSIKISGGKQPKATEGDEKGFGEETGEAVKSADEKAAPIQNRPRHGENKREKRQKYRRKRGVEEIQQQPKENQNPIEGALATAPPESVFSHLLKPPEGLISASIHKYKPVAENEDVAAVPASALDSEPAAKMDDPELFSEPPREYESFQDDSIMEAEHVTFSPSTDSIKPQE